MLNKRCAFEGNTPVRGYGSLPAQDGIFLPAGCADRSKSKNPATQTECAEVLRFQKTETQKGLFSLAIISTLMVSTVSL